MKISRRPILAAAAAALLSCLPLHAANSPGYIDFGKFQASEGETFVEVDIHGALLKLAAAFTRREEPAVADLIANLERVRVNVVGLTDGNRANTADRVRELRASLDREGWTRVVTVQEHGGEDVAVFIKEAGADTLHGIVVTVMSDNREAVLVNVVGNVDINQIALLGERLDIAPLRELKLRELGETTS